jgi:hypothetical protein
MRSARRWALAGEVACAQPQTQPAGEPAGAPRGRPVRWLVAGPAAGRWHPGDGASALVGRGDGNLYLTDR